MPMWIGSLPAPSTRRAGAVVPATARTSAAITRLLRRTQAVISALLLGRRAARARASACARAARGWSAVPVASLHGGGVDRAAHRAGHRAGVRAEEHLVDAVGGAIGGQAIEVEDLAHAEADLRDRHPVPRLAREAQLVRPHLDAPGVGRHGGDLALEDPPERV